MARKRLDGGDPICNLFRMWVDHLVWYCADLAEGEENLAGRMDCRPMYGGVHPGEGTCNSLLALGDTTYLEILARDPAQSEACLDAEIRSLNGSGLYHWAASGADLAGLRSKVEAGGLDAGELVTGGRTLPNGNWLGWKLLGIRNHGFGALVPFFIDWMNGEHPAQTAPRGGRLMKLEAGSPEPERLRHIYRILNLDIMVTNAVAPSLSAIVECGSGQQVLRMFDPVPRGYVM